MAEIVNLKRARKRRERSAKERQAEENRARFGRTGAEKAETTVRRERDKRDHDGHKLDDDER